MADTALYAIGAVVAALRSNAAVTAIAGQRVYSDVPQDCDFPYVRVSVESEPFASNTFSAQKHTVRIACYSRADGVMESLQLRQAALDFLDRNEAALTLASGSLVKCEYTGFSTAFQEDDGRTWQAIGELELIIN